MEPRAKFTCRTTVWEDHEMGVRNMRFAMENLGVAVQVEIMHNEDVDGQLTGLWQLAHKLPDLIGEVAERIERGDFTSE